jgi:hypothetical protein
MDNKKRVIRLIENYLNDFQKDAVEQIYGKGSKIKIHNLDFTVTNPSVLVESIIVLGEEISDDTMDRELADILIQDALNYFFPNLPVKVSMRWDV